MIRRRWRDKSELKRKLNLLLCSTGNLHNSTNNKYFFFWVVREHDFILFYSVRYVCRIIMYCIILWYDMCDAIYNLQNKFQRNSFWQTHKHASKHFLKIFMIFFIFFYIPAKRFFLENIPHVSLTSHLTKHLHHKTIKREKELCKMSKI